MSSQDILPVGSVVRLASTNAAAMIIGYEPVMGDDRADYLAVPYPMGLVTDESAIAFDRSSIGDVLFMGFCDREGEETFNAIRSYREAEQDMLDQVNHFIDTLTPERVQELRERYAPAELPEEFEVPEGFVDVKVD